MSEGGVGGGEEKGMGGLQMDVGGESRRFGWVSFPQKFDERVPFGNGVYILKLSLALLWHLLFSSALFKWLSCALAVLFALSLPPSLSLSLFLFLSLSHTNTHISIHPPNQLSPPPFEPIYWTTR